MGGPSLSGGVAPDTTAITAPVDGMPILALIDEASIPDADVRARLSALRPGKSPPVD